MPSRTIQYRYHPHNSYVRAYVNHFFEMNANYISGSVLDLGAGGDNEQQYRELSSEINEYFSADISYSSELDMIADARCLPFDDDSFDTVILSEVLEHIPIQDVKIVLEEVKRILKTSGKLLASTPFILPIHGEPYDFHRATYYGLESVLDEVDMNYKIIIGGGYSQVILHQLHRPIYILSEMIGTRIPLYLFGIIHYLFIALGFMIGNIFKIILDEDAFNRRYITQFVIASPEEI